MQVEHQNSNNYLVQEIINSEYNLALSCLYDDRLDYAFNCHDLNKSFDIYIAERNLNNCVVSIRQSIQFFT